MLKNIKLFSTDSDRTTYESSASYETPYVSKVQADGSVHYNKLIVMTTFTINRDPQFLYLIEQGMTWGLFINSNYNTGGFTLNGGSGNAVYWNGPLSLYNESEHSMNGVYADDIILDDDTIPSYMEYYSD